MSENDWILDAIYEYIYNGQIDGRKYVSKENFDAVDYLSFASDKYCNAFVPSFEELSKKLVSYVYEILEDRSLLQD